MITDVHFGRNGNNWVANQDNIEFLQWAIDRACVWGADVCIFGGDYFDTRHSVGVLTLNYALLGLEMLNSSFKKVFLNLGNHDLFYREKRDVSSVEFAKHFTNIEIIHHPCEIGGVTFLPWLVGDEYKAVKDIKTRYVFGHLEMPGFMMNARVEMPDSPHLIKPDQFVGPEFVFSGHFHARQYKLIKSTNIVYTGNIIPFTFSDVDDGERGMMLLEWGHDPIFEAWPDQPLYHNTKLSTLIENPDRYLRPKMTVRASVDVPLLYEEAQELRDMLVQTYDLRKIELMQHQTNNEVAEQTMTDNVEFQTVDQMVIEGLMSVESNGLSKDRLIEIYRSLQEAS